MLPISAYWWTGRVNFGDLITPLLLRMYGFNPANCPIAEAQLLSTGSILTLAATDYSGHILGSGLVAAVSRPFPNAKIWAVRGALTRQRIGASPDVALGDPGLLASRLLDRRQEKCHKLGIVPHYVDWEDPRIAAIGERAGDDVLVIDVRREPIEVFRDIDSCEHIMSSSLHGIITADSLGIPSAWILLSDKVIGNGFKFLDHGSAVGVEARPVEIDGTEGVAELLGFTSAPPEESVERAKQALDGAFRALREHFEASAGSG